MEVMDKAAEFFNSPWWTVILQVIGAASVAAAITPNKVDNVVFRILKDVLNVVALNFQDEKKEKR